MKPELVSPGPRGGTSRLPRKMALASNVVVVDRYSAVVEAPAGVEAMFFVKSSTEMVAPAPGLDEAAGTSRNTIRSPLTSCAPASRLPAWAAHSRVARARRASESGPRRVDTRIRGAIIARMGSSWRVDRGRAYSHQGSRRAVLRWI